jgi:hypothetical protein
MSVIFVGSRAVPVSVAAPRKTDTPDFDFIVSSDTEKEFVLKSWRRDSHFTPDVFVNEALGDYAWAEVDPEARESLLSEVSQNSENLSEILKIPTLDELYTLRASHVYWFVEKTWLKHMFALTKYKAAGAELNDELHDVAYREWEKLYGKKKANLNAEPGDFFNASVTRIYDHDSIHESIAYTPGKPLFSKILRDDSKIAVSREKFQKLTEIEKLQLVREEVFATALERQLIPRDYEYSPRRAYDWALTKLITSFSKGWFTMYVVDHYSELRVPDIDFVARHKEHSDLLRPF